MDGFSFLFRSRTLQAIGLMVVVAAASTGCSTSSDPTVRRLINHQAMIDFSGLKDAETVDAVKINVAAPASWTPLSLKQTNLFTDMHWKSPSGVSGVGVAYLRLPIPLSPRMLLWFAKGQYSRSDGGRVIGEWTDEFGRHWFEGANDKYHARGFVITHGREAWIIYCGYKTIKPPDATELSLAAKCLDTIVPLPRGSTYEPEPATQASAQEAAE